MSVTDDVQRPAQHTRDVELWGGRITVRVRHAGTGDPLLYLHPTTGPAWIPFLDRLAERYTVYAPEFPGTTDGDPYAIHVIDELSDVVLMYEELVRRLDLERPVVVGHSFGGMLAAELAAHHTALPGRLVLIDPLGLWQAQLPVVNLAAAPAEQIPGLLFCNPADPAIQAALKPPADPAVARAALVRRVWSMGCTGKFSWPFPEHGLRHRLHRIAAPTLLVWGREDRVVPLGYAREFAAQISDATLAVIDECGHLPPLERPKQTLAVLDEFLG